MENPGKKPVCVIVGAGPGIGAGNAHKFSKVSQNYSQSKVCAKQ